MLGREQEFHGTRQADDARQPLDPQEAVAQPQFGGMNLAACCDLRYCNEGARFGVPAAKLGLGYGFLRIERLSRIVGLPRAMEFLFTAKQYSSTEAYDMGLVNGVAATPSSTRWSTASPTRSRRMPRSPSRSPRRLTRDRQAGVRAGPQEAGADDRSLLRQRGLQGRPPRLHGEEEAGFQRTCRGPRPQWTQLPLCPTSPFSTSRRIAPGRPRCASSPTGART